MLVVGEREGVHVALKDILAARLADRPCARRGARGQCFVNRFERLAGKLPAKNPALQVQSPKILEFFPRCGPRRFAAVEFHGLVDGEVELVHAASEQLLLERDSLQGTVAVAVVDGERGFEVSVA